MWTIETIGHRKILNSHVELTTEYSIRLNGGSQGRGASPQGETIGVYEDDGRPVDPVTVIATMRRGGRLGPPLDQATFDDFLAETIAPSFGKNTCYALSLAFFNAVQAASGGVAPGLTRGPAARPRICCNILNGGWHAYTNPVLSDFPEYLLVARSDDIDEIIGSHAEIQRAVRESLAKRLKVSVGGNPVSRFATVDDRECIEFLLAVCDGLGLADAFDLMIDASAGDLWSDGGYRLALTDESVRTSEEFCAYWLDLVRQYPLRYLEDPFGEADAESWSHLVASQQTCRVIGDNFYSSDAVRIEEGAARKCSHGVIVKPNQAGTVSAACRAIEAARRTGQIIIASHRSVSTESCLLATLTCMSGVEYIKIGPLFTDYSSVIRLNEIIRLTTDEHASAV